MKFLKPDHVTEQPDSYSCVLTCISMATGISIKEIDSKLLSEGFDYRKSQGLFLGDTYWLLNSYGIWMDEFDPRGLHVGDGFYFGKVPSLGRSNTSHFIYIVIENNEPQVYDPSPSSRYTCLSQPSTLILFRLNSLESWKEERVY